MIQLFHVQYPQYDDQHPSGSPEPAAAASNSGTGLCRDIYMRFPVGMFIVSSFAGLSPGRSGMRRDSTVGGVRQSHGNWQSRDRRGEMLAWTKRCVVRRLYGVMLKQLTGRITAKGESELQHYRVQRKKRPAHQPDQVSQKSRTCVMESNGPMLGFI